MTRLHIVHTTTYHYNSPVTVSYNEARLTPLNDLEQGVLETSLAINPPQTGVSSYNDYWGTRVTAFDLQSRHERLTITATSTVETFRGSDPGDGGASWAQLHSSEASDQFGEWLAQTQLTGPGAEVQILVAAAVGSLPPAAAAVAVLKWLRDGVEYVKGVTAVTTSAEQVWAHRKGVCQDLAHLGIGALRSIGIPARYVSGYIHPVPEAALGETVAGQSHAWLQWWDGRWHSWDPTNHGPAGNLHVSVAVGRDYRDVSPLRGILSGGGGSVLDVQVDIARIA
ncbi:transglutaminase family protein [Arthrobacter sp. 35W]|uniref:transglutaminase family protein n=1 Tax=Arthrobacter sp. 35W TaxID=1132441 RepID=UPI000415B074|nr:transglutaminase family protein [Arthrobacter sp. 35W]